MLTHALFMATLLGIFANLFSIYILQPLAHKPHLNINAFIGGIALFVGFWVSVLTLPYGVRHMWGVLLAASLLVWIGAIKPQTKYALCLQIMTQICAILILIYSSHSSLIEMGFLFVASEQPLIIYRVTITVLAMLAYIHAMKKLNTLLSKIALGQTVLLAILSFYCAHIMLFQILVCFSLLLLTYVLFNAWFIKQHDVGLRLGDAGGAFIALFIGWAVLKLSQTLVFVAISPISILWILCFPFINMTRHSALIKTSHSILSSLGFGITGLVMAGLNVSDAMQGLCFILAVVIYKMIIRKHMDWRLVHIVDEGKLVL